MKSVKCFVKNEKPDKMIVIELYAGWAFVDFIPQYGKPCTVILIIRACDFSNTNICSNDNIIIVLGLIIFLNNILIRIKKTVSC